MKVFNYNNTVINVEDNCPSIVRMEGAEEIPIEIFGDYPNFANNDNTKLVDGEWVFTFDTTAYELESKITQERTWRDSQLPTVDIAINIAEDSGDDTGNLRAYRQALRDYPQQEDFPHGTRPEVSL